MGISDELSPALLALMDRQGGVFTAAQARKHGHTDDQLQRMRRKPPRPLVSVRRGVYAFREVMAEMTPLEKHALGLAALEHRLRSDFVVSHQSAAAAHGLEMLDPDLDLLHVTRPDDVRPRRQAGVQHHIGELAAHDVVRQSGELHLTSVARTAIDVARDVKRFECAVAVLDSALRAGVTREELQEVHMRCSNWQHASLVGSALAIADGRAANPGESWSRVVLIRGGVPPLDLQVPVYDEEGLVGYADFGWDGVLGEFDGKGKYSLRGEGKVADVLWNEKRREDRMRVGHEVVRWTTSDLHHPAGLVGRVNAALARVRNRRGPTGSVPA